MLYLDYLSHHNAFRHWSLLEKTLLGIGGLILSVSMGSTVSLILIFSGMSALLFAAGMPTRQWFRLWGAMLPFLAVSLMTVIFSFSRGSFTAIWQISTFFGQLGVTAAGLEMAGRLFLRAIAALSCLFFLAGTTPVAHMAAWGARVRVLRPVLEIALLTYRFIFVVLEIAAQIYTAQQSRLGYSTLRRSMRSIRVLAANLGRKSFLTARALFISLSARNYEEQLVFRYPQITVNAKRLLVIFVSLTAIGLSGHI